MRRQVMVVRSVNRINNLKGIKVWVPEKAVNTKVGSTNLDRSHRDGTEQTSTRVDFFATADVTKMVRYSRAF